LPWRPWRVLSVLLGILGALAGVAAALRNLWVMAYPEILCGRDPLELFLNGLPTAQKLPEVFVASGLCSSPIPPLLGLPLPAWSLIGLLVLAALLGLSLRRR
jgi:disulfide bond formation protein DsbB